jgi:predicted RNase H-like HicB family nuclease
MKSYRVVYELDEFGHWSDAVPSVKGCHTYGQSIRQARDCIREVLALFVSSFDGDFLHPSSVTHEHPSARPWAALYRALA